MTTGTALATLVAFGALGAALAAGARDAVAAALVALGAVLLGGAGWFALDEAAGRAAADAWLVALALAHLAAGVALARTPRHLLGLAVTAIGVVAADVALGRLLDGVPLAVAWSAAAIGAAALLARLRRTAGEAAPSTLAASAALAGHAGLAVLHALVIDAPVALLETGGPLGDAVPALLSVAAGLLAAAALAPRGAERSALAAVAVAGLTYLLALALDGEAFVAGLAALAAATAVAGRAAREPLAPLAAGTLVVGAFAHALRFEAPPGALLDGLADPLAAVVALGAAAVAAVVVALVAGGRDARAAAGGLAAVTALHLASTGLVTAVGAGERGQASLSALWALTGLVALVAGLRRDVAPLRAGALALLLAALAKVFLYDLATLDAMARVASFLALGLLLLLAAFAWQRMRPREPEPRT